MARVRIAGTLQQALIVLSIIETLIDEDASFEADIEVGGFKNGSNTGLTLMTWDSSRKCNLFGDPGSDSIIAVIGGMDDFRFEEGTAKDGAERYPFAYNNHYSAARFVVDWLCKGEVNYDNSMS
jgi:hypothetical protein